MAEKQQQTKSCSRKSGNGSQCSPHLNPSSLLSGTTSIQALTPHINERREESNARRQRRCQLATALARGGMRRRAAMCGMEWDGDGNVLLFPPCGNCHQRVAGTEEKGGSSRVVWSSGAGGPTSLLFILDKLTNLRWLTLSILNTSIVKLTYSFVKVNGLSCSLNILHTHPQTQKISQQKYSVTKISRYR